MNNACQYVTRESVRIGKLLQPCALPNAHDTMLFEMKHEALKKFIIFKNEYEMSTNMSTLLVCPLFRD